MHRHDHLLHPYLSSHVAEQLPQQPLHPCPPPHPSIPLGNCGYCLQPFERTPCSDSASTPSFLCPVSLPQSNTSFSHPFAAHHGSLQHSSVTTLPPSHNSSAWVGTPRSCCSHASPRVVVSGWVATPQPASASMQLPSPCVWIAEPQLVQNLADNGSLSKRMKHVPKRMKRVLKHKGRKKRVLEKVSALHVLSDMPASTLAANPDQSITPTNVLSSIIGVPVEAVPTVGRMKPLERGPGWCSLCQRDCGTAAMLQVHMTGKKHRKKLQRHNVVKVTVPEADTNRNVQRVPAMDLFEQIWQLEVSNTGQESKSVTLESNAGKQIQRHSVVKVTGLEADTNRNLQRVPAMDVFKQIQQLEVMPETNAGNQNVNDGMSLAAIMSDSGEKISGDEVDTEEDLHNIATINGPHVEASDDSCEMRKEEITRCELCNVKCDTKAVLEIHFTGKKHAARVRKSQIQNIFFPQ